jgi:hypothetical protein
MEPERRDWSSWVVRVTDDAQTSVLDLSFLEAEFDGASEHGLLNILPRIVRHFVHGERGLRTNESLLLVMHMLIQALQPIALGHKLCFLDPSASRSAIATSRSAISGITAVAGGQHRRRSRLRALARKYVKRKRRLKLISGPSIGKSGITQGWRFRPATGQAQNEWV